MNELLKDKALLDFAIREGWQGNKIEALRKKIKAAETVILENDWVAVKQKAVPEIECESYIYTEAKKETVAALIFDMNTQCYLMRVEATLSSDFTPALKVMTETMEGEETPEQACIRGIAEEFGCDNVEDIEYLGTINGTFNELHKYHIFHVAVNYTSTGFEGDGSAGENKSHNALLPEKDFKQVKDFISWIAFGMSKHRMSNEV